MTTLEQTKISVAADLKPQNGRHRIRFVLGIVSVTIGIADIINVRFIYDPPGPWPREAIFMVLIGIGVIFTNTMVELIKAFTPWANK